MHFCQNPYLWSLWEVLKDKKYLDWIRNLPSIGSENASTSYFLWCGCNKTEICIYPVRKGFRNMCCWCKIRNIYSGSDSTFRNNSDHFINVNLSQKAVFMRYLRPKSIRKTCFGQDWKILIHLFFMHISFWAPTKGG